MGIVEENEWVNWKSESGKLPNPGMFLYLKLTAVSVKKVKMRETKTVSYMSIRE